MRIDLHPFLLQSRQECLKIVHPAGNHERQAARVKIAWVMRENRPYRGTFAVRIILVEPAKDGARTMGLRLYSQMLPVPGVEVFRIR